MKMNKNHYIIVKYLFLFSFFTLILKQLINLENILIDIALITLIIISIYFLYKNKESKEENKKSKEKKIYIILFLIIISLISLYFRINNLTIIHLSTDEEFLLNAVYDLINFGKSNYTRAPLLTSISKFICLIFKANTYFEYLYWTRITSVLAGAFSTIAIFYLGKKISNKTAIISSILWAISPWAIGMAKLAREYSLYSFLIIIFTLISFNFFESIKNKNKKNIIINAIFILIFFIYAFFTDRLSTIKYILIVFLSLFLINSYFLYTKTKAKKYLIYTPIIIFLIIGFLYKNGVKHWLGIKSINFDISWFNFFMNPNSPPLMWYGHNKFLLIVMFLSIISFVYLYFKKNKALLSYLFIFIITIILYSTILKVNLIKPRYIYYALPFFTIIIASSIDFLIETAKIFKNNKYEKFLFSILLITFLILNFKIGNSLHAKNSTSYFITYQKNHKVDNLIHYLKNKIEDEEEDYIFITTKFSPILKIEFNIKNENIINIYNKNQDEVCYKIKKNRNNKRGMLIFDTYRNPIIGQEENNAIDNYLFCDKNVLKIMDIDQIQIYKW
ncbi:hypothetical protein CVU82_00375 [Candidatus Falkowbacteria bacterium HGW-Falkowbacteria-1]|uniref:Glycosyltransferase RgtA/B/C/D-like domain-containing protein n=1 Tax=Candidatus Falkowbacteria bacterium HGW-Falkowbacteria-1 TaxID=2013768 RepID=A0A2N2EA82_9BACT|nr:MAG: hypothetical protein CVU82_00375 [Candidatus Falkowbacteria bacterium HGW-Falkowbacteria-1]